MMNALLIVSALFALSPKTAPAPIAGRVVSPVELTVNVTDGESLSGDRAFRVIVNTDETVTKVEFYVAGDLRDNDTSTPYEFKLDTLAETDGNLKIKFSAYTSEGSSGTKEFTVKVDNGVGLGADFHIKKGLEYLADSKFDEAITQGRIALKADERANGGRLVLARAFFGKNVMDRAQKYAEDAIAQDPNYVDALEILSAINLKRAFRTVNTGGDRNETLSTIREAIKSAVTSRKKSLDIVADRLSGATPLNPIAAGDAAIKAARYSLAIQILKSAYEKDQRRADLGNRLAFAQMRSGRWGDSIQTLENLRKFGQLNAYSNALQAVIYCRLNQDVASDDAIRNALLADADNVGVKTAQAYIALKRNRTAVLAKIAQDLAKDSAQRPEVSYFASALANRLKQFSEGRRYFERAVLAEPASYDTYIEQGNQSIAVTQLGKLEQKDLEYEQDSARAMYEAALLARPESADALTGLAVISMFKKDANQAIKFAQAATEAGPTNAGAYYALAGAYNMARTANSQAAAQKAIKRAGILDRHNLEGRELPDATAVWRYLNNDGRDPILSAPN